MKRPEEVSWWPNSNILMAIPPLACFVALQLGNNLHQYAHIFSENDFSLALPLKESEDDVITSLPSLDELVRTITNSTGDHNYVCPEGTIVFPDTPIPPLPQGEKEKKIPRVVHITARNRCVPNTIYDHLKQWELKGHGLYFHDDEAIHRLFRHALMENNGEGLVPNMERVLSCVTSGATLSDIWRYTVLWYYGGIYTDIDNAPTGFDGHTIEPDDDALMPLESLGIVSQFFITASPRHPLMLHSLNYAIHALSKTQRVMINNPAVNTGPKAIKLGFIHFQNAIGISTDGYVPSGLYEGGFFDTENGLHPLDGATPIADAFFNQTNHIERRSLKVIGSKNNSREFVHRSGMQGKMTYMNANGMLSYHSSHKRMGNNTMSCKQHIAVEEDRIKQTLNVGTIPSLTPAFVQAHKDWYPRYRPPKR